MRANAPSAHDLEAWLLAHLAEATAADPRHIDPQEPFARLGLGSVQATRMVAELADRLGRTLSATLVWEYPTPAALAAYLATGAPQELAQGASVRAVGRTTAHDELGAIFRPEPVTAAVDVLSQDRSSRINSHQGSVTATKPCTISPVTSAPFGTNTRHHAITIPFEFNGIAFDVFRDEHRQAGLTNLVQEFALRETMNRAIGIGSEDFRPFAEAVCDNALKDGLSVVALDKNTGSFIAPLFSWEYSNNFLAELDIPRLRPIMALLGQLAGMFEKASHHLLTQRIYYINLMAIPDQHRGRGVGHGLWLAGLVHGLNSGCTLAVAAPTDGPGGPSSRHCLNKMRFTKMFEVSYRDFEYEGEHVFAGRTSFETAFFAAKPLHSEADLRSLAGGRTIRSLSYVEAEAFRARRRA